MIGNFDQDYIMYNETYMKRMTKKVKKEKQTLKLKHYNGSIFIQDKKNHNRGFILSLHCPDKYYISDLECNSIHAIRDRTISFMDIIEKYIDCYFTGTSTYFIETDLRSTYPMTYGCVLDTFEVKLLDIKDELLDICKTKLSDEFKKHNYVVNYIQLDWYEYDTKTGKSKITNIDNCLNG